MVREPLLWLGSGINLYQVARLVRSISIWPFRRTHQIPSLQEPYSFHIFVSPIAIDTIPCLLLSKSEIAAMQDTLPIQGWSLPQTATTADSIHPPHPTSTSLSSSVPAIGFSTTLGTLHEMDGLYPTVDQSIDMPAKLEPISEDTSTPFFFGNILEAISGNEARPVDILANNTPISARHLTASSLSSALASYPETLGSWSSIPSDSRPATMASSFTTASLDGSLPSHLTSAFCHPASMDKAVCSGYCDPVFGLAIGHQATNESKIGPLQTDFAPPSSSKQMHTRRFTTGSEPRPVGITPSVCLEESSQKNSNWHSMSFDPHAKPTTPLQSFKHASLASVKDAQGQHERIEPPSTACKVSPEDSLALWLGQDILSELLDEIKGEHPGPISEACEQASEPPQDLTEWGANLCRRRRNAIVQLPAVVSCGLMATMVSAESESDSTSASSSEQGDVTQGGDLVRHAVDQIYSPHSCPLSPSTRPVSPKSGLKSSRSASFNDASELPQMHQILSSWDFTCDRGRYRKLVKRGRAHADARQARKSKKMKQTERDAKKASRSQNRRGPGRPRTTKVSLAKVMDCDPDSDSENMACCDSAVDLTDDSDEGMGREGSEGMSSKRLRGHSKSSGNTFSITSRIVLRPRVGTDEEEVPYPHLPATFEEASKNDGPDASQGGDDATDESSVVFPTDLYAPRFARRGPYGREGWCSLCTQGEWYSMKRSQYLYHLQYDHGVCSLTRKMFEAPVHLRVWNDAMERTEGLCHHCQEWIPICFGAIRKRDYKAWFKHAHRCHRHKA